MLRTTNIFTHYLIPYGFQKNSKKFKIILKFKKMIEKLEKPKKKPPIKPNKLKSECLRMQILAKKLKKFKRHIVADANASQKVKKANANA